MSAVVGRLGALVLHVEQEAERLAAVCDEYEACVEAKERPARSDRRTETLTQRQLKREKKAELETMLEEAQELRESELARAASNKTEPGKASGSKSRSSRRPRTSPQPAIAAVDKKRPDPPAAESDACGAGAGAVVDQAFARESRPPAYASLRKRLGVERKQTEQARAAFVARVAPRLRAQGLERTSELSGGTAAALREEQRLMRLEADALVEMLRALEADMAATPPLDDLIAANTSAKTKRTDPRGLLDAVFRQWFLTNLVAERSDALKARFDRLRLVEQHAALDEYAVHAARWRARLVAGGKRAFKSKQAPPRKQLHDAHCAPLRRDVLAVAHRLVFRWASAELQAQAPSAAAAAAATTTAAAATTTAASATATSGDDAGDEDGGAEALGRYMAVHRLARRCTSAGTAPCFLELN